MNLKGITSACRKINGVFLVIISAIGLSSARVNAAVSPVATAVFVKADTATQGNWFGTYGAEGYSVAGDLTSKPRYASPSLSGQSTYSWSVATNDVRYLEKASNTALRIGGQWTTIDSMTLSTKFTDQLQHQVAIYCLDWDSSRRKQSVSVLDSNNNVIDTRSLTTSFHGGVYLVWNVRGNVRFKITNLVTDNSANATISGFFFDSVPTSVSVTINPSSSSLVAGQQLQFSSSVTGTTNSSVSWTSSPAGVGSISGTGLYVAPSSLSSPQIVSVTATSVVDTTKSATAAITLQPAVSVSVSPSGQTLTAGQTQQFSASVTGSTNKAVIWSILPSTGAGTIDSLGVYSAPASVTVQQTVTVVATSIADSTKSAGVSLILAPTSVSTIVLPIEVMGANGTMKSVPFGIPGSANLISNKLLLRIHGLDYENKLSVQLNGGAWIPVNSQTATLQGLAAKYGGIGGGFSTISLTLNLPAGYLHAGSNSVQFQFVATDGVSVGFRILSFNILDLAGNAILPQSAFVSEDPNSWQPPSTQASDIAAGKGLWQNAPLTVPSNGASKAVLAHCGDCHTQDGRDLKYFNYSNYAIRARAVFHGLTAAQGDQIASYIRSLIVPNPGRPWNPPYQPGPGLDSQPVAQWAAGAGVDAVLGSDSAMLPYVAPTQTAADFDPSTNTKVRETPIAFQLPDWNRWLPRIHPLDAWGPAFAVSPVLTRYQQLAKNLIPASANAYTSQRYNIDEWSQLKNDFKGTVPAGDFTTVSGATQMYSLNQWQIVKMWELNQQFGLEGMAPSIYGAQGESRAWMTNIPFQTSPSISKIPRGAPGIGNGTPATFDYSSFMWYYTQFVLNDGNKYQMCTNPIDWGYFYGFVGSMTGLSAPQGILLMNMLQSAMRISNNGKSPDFGCTLGWSPVVNDPSRLVSVSLSNIWTDLPPATTSALVNAYVGAWFSVLQNFTAQQMYTGGFTTANETLTHGYSEGNMISRFAFMIPHLKFLGLSPTLTDSITRWAAGVWPTVDWVSIKNASCSLNANNIVHCTSD